VPRRLCCTIWRVEGAAQAWTEMTSTTSFSCTTRIVRFTAPPHSRLRALPTSQHTVYLLSPARRQRLSIVQMAGRSSLPHTLGRVRMVVWWIGRCLEIAFSRSTKPSPNSIAPFVRGSAEPLPQCRLFSSTWPLQHTAIRSTTARVISFQ
jgi:hypothetical protein